jgi:exopolyphosphatase/pppGpp-phosphohydrolase
MRELAAAQPDTVAVCSGTARAVLRLARRLGLVADGQHHLWRRTLTELAYMLAPMPPEALACLGVHASRVDTIAVGAAVLDAALAPLGRSVVYVARSGLREGVLIDGARARAGRRVAAR